jgi:hypothetical protein
MSWQEIRMELIKEQLRTNTKELVARGGFGSPTIFVAGNDKYFGNDRLPLAREALLRQRIPEAPHSADRPRDWANGRYGPRLAQIGNRLRPSP